MKKLTTMAFALVLAVCVFAAGGKDSAAASKVKYTATYYRKYYGNPAALC